MTSGADTCKGVDKVLRTDTPAAAADGTLRLTNGAGAEVARLKFDGKNLVLAEEDTLHGPFVPQD